MGDVGSALQGRRFHGTGGGRQRVQDLPGIQELLDRGIYGVAVERSAFWSPLLAGTKKEADGDTE